jgi:NADPH:quinone reductase-like Zn-dependent oxidoreductase
MKAIKCIAYGSPDVLKVVEIEKPLPRENEVLVKIHASTVTMGDCELRTLTLPLWTRIPMRLLMGYRKPRNFIPGMEFSGIVESVGKNVTSIKKGDAVFAGSDMNMGANAEYKCHAARALAIKPSGVSFEQAATIPVGGINALHFLRKANVQPGQKVLVIGGGGAIGSYGVQLAKVFGAEVTAIDSTIKLDMLRSIGADHVIDYTQDDFSARDVKYDVIFDTVYSSSFSKCMSSLTSDGVYLMANTGPRRMFRALWASWMGKKKFIFSLAQETVADLNYLASLVASGKIKPFIDKTYPLEQTAQAHAYVQAGNKKGCVVIDVVGGDS